MECSARLFNCVGCQSQVLICSDCDHGNIYCGPICSKLARAESLKETRQRYQKSRKGRFKHAEQQRRYRMRQNIPVQKVMDHGSPMLDIRDSLSKLDETVMPTRDKSVCCHFCGRLCASFLRKDFLRNHSAMINTVLRASWP